MLFALGLSEGLLLEAEELRRKGGRGFGGLGVWGSGGLGVLGFRGFRV